MQKVLVTIASIALATHAVLGCCWHHAHFQTSGQFWIGAERVIVHGDQSHCGCHGHQAPHDDDHHSGTPHGCQEGKCDFVRVEQQNQDFAGLEFVGIPMFVVEPLKATQHYGMGLRCVAEDDLHLHVPLHLLHQILLI